MPNTTFDPRVQVGNTDLFKGAFTNVVVAQSPDVPGDVSNRVINPSKPFQVRLQWKVDGAQVPLRMNAINGPWSIFVYVESMGPGPEIRLNTTPSTHPVGALAANTMSWDVTVDVNPAGLSENVPGGSSGVYRLIVVVFANSTLPGPGNDVIGYYEEPLLILAENPI
jgi:hypothetical protein